MSINTIFLSLGLSVVGFESGVYHLRRLGEDGESGGDVIGLLFSPEQLTKESAIVKLFLQDVEQNVAPARIVYHWQTLDARRFEESGLEAIELQLQPEQLPEPALPQKYTRPDGARTRHATRLTSGEVVCYN